MHLPCGQIPTCLMLFLLEEARIYQTAMLGEPEGVAVYKYHCYLLQNPQAMSPPKISSFYMNNFFLSSNRQRLQSQAWRCTCVMHHWGGRGCRMVSSRLAWGMQTEGRQWDEDPLPEAKSTQEKECPLCIQQAETYIFSEACSMQSPEIRVKLGNHETAPSSHLLMIPERAVRPCGLSWPSAREGTTSSL